VGCGTVYELTRQHRPNDTNEQAPIWTERVLYSFCAEDGTKCTDGANPDAYIIKDAWGRLYSTTIFGGANGAGTVFELTPEPDAAAPIRWTHKILYSFCAEGGANCTDGSQPFSPLIMDARGRLYGVASAGGAHGQGTVFELSR
jgi:uncharacterized repeat protein (TIGR03803 family)